MHHIEGEGGGGLVNISISQQVISVIQIYFLLLLVAILEKGYFANKAVFRCERRVERGGGRGRAIRRRGKGEEEVFVKYQQI